MTEEKIICSKCGAENNSADKFCQECGNSIQLNTLAKHLKISRKDIIIGITLFVLASVTFHFIGIGEVAFCILLFVLYLFLRKYTWFAKVMNFFLFAVLPSVIFAAAFAINTSLYQNETEAKTIMEQIVYITDNIYILVTISGIAIFFLCVVIWWSISYFLIKTQARLEKIEQSLSKLNNNNSNEIENK